MAQDPTPPAPPTPPSPGPDDDALRAVRQACRALDRPDAAGLDAALLAMGQAPAAPGRQLGAYAETLGRTLAHSGRLARIVDLASRGWAAPLFPAGRSEESFLAMLAKGAEGFAAVQSLAQGGASLFAGAADGQNRRRSEGLLSSAFAVGSFERLGWLIARMDAEDPGEEVAGFELTALARSGFVTAAGAKRLLPFVKAAPVAWARANIFGGGTSPCSIALEHGRLDAARAMLAADPEAALSRVETSMCHHFKKPLASVELLAKAGADFDRRDCDGDAALHSAPHCGRDAKAVARRLVELGADPRARNLEGCTPIGIAAEAWRWTDLEAILGANPSDLMDSMHARRHAPGSRHASPLAALMNAHSDDAGKESAEAHRAADLRLRSLVEAASLDPRAREPSFIHEGAALSAGAGLPECLGAFIGLGQAHGSPLSAKHFDRAIQCAARGDSAAMERGRLDCLRLAAAAGVDLDEPFPMNQVGARATLIGSSIEFMVDYAKLGPAHAAPARSLRSAALLLNELGCDPMPCAGFLPDWSFDPAGAGGRSGLPPFAMDAFEEIDALREAKALRASLPQPAAGPAERLRI